MPSNRIKFRIHNRFLAGAALALVLTGAASCSTVWDDVSGFIEDDETNDRVLTNSGDNEDFPKLSEVPNTPRPASSPEDLERLAEGLVADRDDARYTNETLRSRYADQIDENDERQVERQVAAAAGTPEPAARPAQLSAQESADFADQNQAERSLSDERRDSGIEPASEAVIRQSRAANQQDERMATRDKASDSSYATTDNQGATDNQYIERKRSVVAQSQPVSSEPTTLRETRVAAVRQPTAKFGVMKISKFRDLFNARFDSSGRSPLQNSQIQSQTTQVTGNAPATAAITDHTVSLASTDMVRAQMKLTAPEPPIAGSDSDSGLAAISFQAATIPFEIGSSSLSSADRSALKSVVKLHKKFGGVVRVIGHSSRRTRDMDASRHQMVNFQLSLDRATAVSVELARLGVPSQAVMVMSRSDNEPLTYEYMPRGEAQNRRADVYIEY